MEDLISGMKTAAVAGAVFGIITTLCALPVVRKGTASLVRTAQREKERQEEEETNNNPI